MAGFLLSKIMNKQTYYEKLKDPRWQRKRLEVMNRAHFLCEKCYNENNTLNVHHLYYMSKRDPWDYPDFALICICNECHADEHENKFNTFEETIESLVDDQFFNPYILEIINQIYLARESGLEMSKFLYDCLESITNIRQKLKKINQHDNEDQNN